MGTKPTVARRVLPVALAALLLFAATLPPARAVPSPTAANTLQFYGGEVPAVAQIGGTIYVGGSSPRSATAARRSPGQPGGHRRRQRAAGHRLRPAPRQRRQHAAGQADGTHLYAGGVFNNLRGCSQGARLAMLDPATGVPLSWNPGATGTRGVLVAAALPAGLAIGGDFQRTNGVLHSGFALFLGTA